MSALIKIALLVFSLVLVIPSSLEAQEPPAIEVRLSSGMLVVGEQTRLTVSVKNATLIDWPDAPKLAPLALTQLGKNRVIINRRIEEVFEYGLSAYQAGTFTIPPFQLRTRQGLLSSKAITLRVLPVSSLATKGMTIRPNTVPYLSGIFLEKKSPYVGETQAVEAKLYVPNEHPYLLKLHDGQVIKMEKDGIAAWRFTTSDRRPTGILNHDGIRFLVYTYRSSLNALRAGELAIGPGKADAIFEMRARARGGFRTVAQAFPIEFPPAKMTVRALPKPAPPGFAGAVGNFTLRSSTSTRELKLGETLTVEAQVSGSGNLDQFPGPFLLDPEEQWKQFDMIAKPPGSERRTSAGTVEFSQVIRPKLKLDTLPPYRFVFFDPILERYRSLDSPAHPLVMTGEIPSVEGATDPPLTFLAPSANGLRVFAKEKRFPYWLWQIIPALVLSLLIISAIWARLKANRLASQPTREFQSALQELDGKSHDQVEFYREAAKFVTTWRGGEGFEEIFSLRDELCFRPDSPREAVPDPDKNRVLKRLKTLSPLLIFGIFCLQLSPVKGQDIDFKAERSRFLGELKTEPSPEHFHNLALCEKALGKPAKAALWAYRYQAQGGEASAILRDLPGLKAREKKGLDWLSLLPRLFYQQLMFAGLWGALIFTTCLILHRAHPRPLLMGISASVAVLALSLGGGAYFFYPEEVSFKPLPQLAVVSAEEAALLGQPYLGGTPVRENIAGSLCEIQAERRGWLRLELPGGLSGWVQEELVEAIHIDDFSTSP